MYHTVPAVLHAWLRHPNDFRQGMREIIGCGGDTDTTGAILGGIIGARVGIAGIPKAWVDNILEFPRNVAWMKTLAGQIHKMMQGQPEKPINAAFPLIFLRNMFFTAVVLFHGFRRILPPY
jgi:hypothetical protein